VALTVNRRGTDRVFMGRLMEIDNLEGLGVFGRIIIKWIFRK
jgi:aconitase B